MDEKAQGWAPEYNPKQVDANADVTQVLKASANEEKETNDPMLAYVQDLAGKQD